jgi:hypothetical protein
LLRRGAKLAAAVMARPRLYRAAARLVRFAWPLLGRIPNGWTQARAWPDHPGPSFAERWRSTRGRSA